VAVKIIIFKAEKT